MKPWRKGLAVIVLAAAGIAAWTVGDNLVRNVQFTHAQQEVEASRQQLSQVEDLAAVFRAVGKAVEPSVVSIDVTKTIRGISRTMPFGGDEDLLRRFFEQHGQQMPDMREFEQQGVGSGFIIEVENGSAYIVTNNHVVGDADEMRITLHDGRVINNGKVVGSDPKTDLALVKIDVDRVIPAKWGDSDQLQKGDWVLAFGSPFRYVGSMTHGIVSALERHDVGILAMSGGYENFIQVDAAINPGNSGGPLANVRGEVIGINTAIATRTGAFAGIGFAIPSNQAKAVYQQLKEHGKVTRGWLGVSIGDVSTSPGMAESFGLEENRGVLVNDVLPGTPAIGKLRRGDVILAIDGQKVDTSHHLRALVAAKQPNTDIKLTIWRERQQQDVTITLGEQPDQLVATRGGPRGETSEPEQRSADALGLRLGSPTAEQLQSLGFTGDQRGAIVLEVTPRSPAARAGIMPRDLITQVGEQEVTTAKQAMEALAKHDVENDGVRLYILRGDSGRFFFLKGSN